MGSAKTSPTTADPEPSDDASGTSRQGARHEEPALPRTGHLLAGKYRIDGILGRGGMGVVAAGHQLNLDRPVAIKFLRHTLAETSRQRFTREAMAVAKMRSDHVVRIFDAGEENGVPFIVMERLLGNDLAEELRHGPLAPEVAVKYMLEACEAITEAHSLGIIHRDLKPSNLYVAKGANGRRSLKVLDFGVSKWLDMAPDGETPLSTAEHGIIGTPAYVSPEQLTTPNAVDERSDVWSLGVALYQCLCGKRPFEGRSVPQLCASILTATVPDFDRKHGVPESLVAIVRRCLKKKPGERYQSVRALSEALGAFRAPRSAAERAFDALRARRGLAALVAVAGMATAGVLFRARVPDEPTAEPVATSVAAANPAVDSRNSALEAESPRSVRERAVEAAPGELASATTTAAAASSSPAPPVRSGGRRVSPSRAKIEPVPSARVDEPPVVTSAQAVEQQPAAEASTKPMYRR